jgi:site-specific recombinase XerD
VALAARRRRGHFTGHENDEGGALFQWLLENIGCSTDAAATTQHAWADATFRKYRHTLTQLCHFLARANKPKDLLLDAGQAMGCAISFLQEEVNRGANGTGIKAMAGQVRRVLQMLHPLGDWCALAQFAKALRRRYPTVNRIRDTIWDLDVLLNYLQARYADNGQLSEEDLLVKAMLLLMVFAASRPVELARMELPAAEEVGESQALLRSIPKQRGTERTSVPVHRLSIDALCPLLTLKAWLLRRKDTSQLLFRRRPPACALENPTTAGPGPCYQDLTTGYIRGKFRAVMRAAGIPAHYPPYTIRHATVTALFSRGASDEEVAAFGRWAPGSKVPRLFYYIRATDGTWIGKKLISEQPALKAEFLLLRGQGSSRVEAEDEPSSTDSSPASGAE